MKLIEKYALVAEIVRRIKYDEMVMNHNAQITELLSRELNTLYELLSFIKSHDVKGVDLEKEIMRYQREIYDRDTTVKDVAKHFFKLGLMASNSLTWEDMMTIHKCCKDAMNCNLYAWETAEGQQKIYEDVLKRFKAQKQENLL